ncbi:MAG: hypothetical protein ABSH16_04995 [Sedimentisphaerales bacterium]
MSPKIKLAGMILYVLFAAVFIVNAAPYSPHEAASQSYAHDGAVTVIDNNFTGTDFQDINGLSVNVLSGKAYLVKAGLSIVQASYLNDPCISLGGTAKGKCLQGFVNHIPDINDANIGWLDVTSVISVEEMGTMTVMYGASASGVDTVKKGSYMKIEPLN